MRPPRRTAFVSPSLVGGIGLALTVAFAGASGCGPKEPADTDSLADFCYWFDRIRVTTPYTPEFHIAFEDYYTASVAYARTNDAPGIEGSAKRFAEALDERDLQSLALWEEGMASYCEPYYEEQADVGEV